MTKSDFHYWHNKFQNVLRILESRNLPSATHLKQFTIINQIKRTVTYTGDNLSLAKCYLPSSAFRKNRLCSLRPKEIVVF